MNAEEIRKKLMNDIHGGLSVLSDPEIVVEGMGAVPNKDGTLTIPTEEGPVVVYFEIKAPYTTARLTEIGDIVAKADFTPLDLLKWEYLLELDSLIMEAGFSNFMLSATLHEEIKKALYRKAKALDIEKKTTFHTDMIKSRPWYPLVKDKSDQR